MAEIKSTLELAMERTRHLSMSAEEKAEQQQADFQKRLQGLLQQYADQVVTTDAFKKRLDALQQEFKMTDASLVIDAILHRLDPGLDNRHWLALLTLLAPSARPLLDSALTAYREAAAEFRHKGQQAAMDRLARNHHITGSALVPNLIKDTHYQSALAQLRQGFQTRIQGISNQIATS